MSFGRWASQADMLRVLDTLVALRSAVERDWRPYPDFSLTMALYGVTGGDARFYRAMNQLRPELTRRGLSSLVAIVGPESTRESVLEFISTAGADIISRMWALPPGISEEEEREQMLREWGGG